ncbi:MAG: NRDE family protein, partial [Burkholderiales bacterium]
GGTWMGYSQRGRFAAVTNFREGGSRGIAPRSRGGLVANFLRGTAGAGDYAREVLSRGADYNGFTLLVEDGREMWAVSNREPTPRRVEPGVHGLSNHLLDTPWPKVTAGVSAVRTAAALPDTAQTVAALFEALAGRTIPPDEQLPATGVGLPRERVLSPPFIVSEGYGTRASSVLLVPYSGVAEFHERGYGPGGVPLGRSSHRIPVAQAAVTVT